MSSFRSFPPTTIPLPHIAFYFGLVVVVLLWLLLFANADDVGTSAASDSQLNAWKTELSQLPPIELRKWVANVLSTHVRAFPLAMLLWTMAQHFLGLYLS